MMHMKYRSACRLKCPVCGSSMEFILPPHRPGTKDDCDGQDVHSFICTARACGVRWTAWDLNVEGLKEGYDRAYRETAEWLERQKQGAEALAEERSRMVADARKGIERLSKQREEAYSAEAHAPMDATCEKCGRICCDHENKY